MATFPLGFRPTFSYRDGPRCYGAARAGGRRHAGCDLYAPVGSPVLAISDGTVRRGPYDFYAGTMALEVDHGEFYARYGEIGAVAAGIAAGAPVREGQVIAYVGKLSTMAQAMLHLECYRAAPDGPLTDRDNPPWMRRQGHFDPADLLDGARVLPEVREA